MEHAGTDRPGADSAQPEFQRAHVPADHDDVHGLRDADSESRLPAGFAGLYRVAGGPRDGAARDGPDGGDVLPRRNRQARLRYASVGGSWIFPDRRRELVARVAQLEHVDVEFHRADDRAGYRDGINLPQPVGRRALFGVARTDGLRGEHLLDVAEYRRLDRHVCAHHDAGAARAGRTELSRAARLGFRRMAAQPRGGGDARLDAFQLHEPDGDRAEARLRNALQRGAGASDDAFAE